VEVGTLSKAFGVMGGVAAGSALLVDYLRQKARPNLFSSALTIPDVAANLASLEILEESDELVRRLWHNGDFLKSELRRLGFNTGHSETPITPVIIGEASDAKTFSARLFEAGVFATAIAFPTVPQGTARIRAMVSAAHSEEDLSHAVRQFAAVGRKMGILP
ncbi:MAG: aminotransferase class I/II-fold pyridoxal phosphate-dependent enzyme, partial [Synergistales bacterium]|nr:aminotransferase class I/II-fold pyridoxal phosphate-dependent enzyme [Synergistales bacterium]